MRGMHRSESTPARPRRKVLFPAIINPQPERKGCHPKGRNEVEDVRSTLTPLQQRLRSAPIPPTDSSEDPKLQGSAVSAGVFYDGLDAVDFDSGIIRSSGSAAMPSVPTRATASPK